MCSACYINTAAAGIAFGGRATQFLRRLDAADMHEDVDGGINRQRYDIWHSTDFVVSFKVASFQLGATIGKVS